MKDNHGNDIYLLRARKKVLFRQGIYGFAVYVYRKVMCRGTGDVDSQRRLLKFFSDVELPKEFPISVRSGCLKAGTYFVVKKAIELYKLDEEIKRIIGKDAGLFLDLAVYVIVSESNAVQYYPDYAYNHPLYTEEMKDIAIQRYLHF